MQEEISGLKQTDLLKALAVVNIFETGRPFGQFAAIAVLDDGAGISYGINQFTHRSGSLAGVVERYLELGGTAGRYILENALPNLRRKEPFVIRAYAKNERVKKALRAAAVTREMRTAQLQIAFKRYLEPAIDQCVRVGLVTPLSLAVIYDSITHGSYERIRDRVTMTPLGVPPPRPYESGHPSLDKEGSFPRGATLAFEKAWVAEYVRQRDRWLASIPRLNATRYRTRFFLNQIMLGSWELKLPLNVNGFWLRNEHIEDLLKFADVMIGTEPAAGPIFEPHKQSDKPATTSSISSQVLTPNPQAQPPDSDRNATPAPRGHPDADWSVMERAGETLKTVTNGFDRADAIITGFAYRSDRVKSFWTTVLGTTWQAAWAVFGFIVGMPKLVWLVVAVIAAALMLVYLYRQVALGKLREMGPHAARVR